MDEATLLTLLTAAAGIGLVHTLIGADHYLPFVVLGRAQKWSLRRTLGITALCGLGHVVGSVAVGAIGIAAGLALDRMEWIEAARGAVAAWLLIGFGLAYFTWATWRALRGRRHAHAHVHGDGTLHAHGHDHHGEHAHPHAAAKAVTKWTLFVLFVLGPCEALIPLLMVPAAALDAVAVALVVLVFGAVTIATMVAAVAVGHAGLRLAPTRSLERWGDSLAGLAIVASGVAIRLLGV